MLHSATHVGFAFHDGLKNGLLCDNMSVCPTIAIEV